MILKVAFKRLYTNNLMENVCRKTKNNWLKFKLFLIGNFQNFHQWYLNNFNVKLLINRDITGTNHKKLNCTYIVHDHICTCINRYYTI